VRAARLSHPGLSNRFAAFGHSDGGHAVLGVEAHLRGAPELRYVGTVASVPYGAIAATAASFAAQARAERAPAAVHTARMMEQFQVALMSTGLMAQSPAFDPRAIMGEDLASVLPAFRAQCSVKSLGIIDAAVKRKGAAFAGAKPGWAQHPAMRAFLEANDPAVTPGFALRQPTLVVQGTADGFVLEPLTSKLVQAMQAAGSPVEYKRYAGADHFSVIRQSQPDVLAFLQARFKQ